MTLKELLDEFLESVRKRSPNLANDFEPGLPAQTIRRAFEKMKLVGEIEPVVEIFTWRNGTRHRQGQSLEQSSPFPHSSFCFEDFELLYAHFKGFEGLVQFSGQARKTSRQYFPIFWDSSDRWISVDLAPSSGQRIVLIDLARGPNPRKLYSSVNDLFADAIRANLDNEKLRCFET